MLHVTNGSIVLMRLHDLGLGGETVAWDDVLHEGPVPAGLDLAELRRARAAFIASAGWADADSAERSMQARDETLRAALDVGEVVLWFEHDLYDQLQLLQALAQLADAGGRDRGGVSGVLTGDYLGGMPDDVLRKGFAERHQISEEQWVTAAQAWTAFRSTDPSALEALVAEGAPHLPHLVPALRRHLQQFPSVSNGLSRTEQQTLAALAAGPRTVRETFIAANHAAEQAIFMGDAGWWLHIRPLIEAAHPLVRVEGACPESYTDPAWWLDEPGAPRLALTADGERVLGGAADHLELNGINRWLGGIWLAAGPAAANRRPPPGRARWQVPSPVVWRWSPDPALEA
jgi:hypothetical protein